MTATQKPTSEIVLVTDRDHPNLTAGDQLYAQALRELGCTVTAALWDDPTWMEREIDLVVLRSPWDTWQSPTRGEAFDSFINALDELPTGKVENATDLLRFGADKANLLALASAADIEIPDTVVLDDPRRAAAVVVDRGWAAGVAKPRFGGSGWGVELVEPGKDWVETDSGWIVQEHLPTIVDGEINVVVIDGSVSHAVRKRPADGEWRTNWRFQPHWAIDQAPSPAVDTAKRVVDSLDVVPLYARVDGVMDGERFVVIEVELVSPSLFLTMQPDAAITLAEATVRRC